MPAWLGKLLVGVIVIAVAWLGLKTVVTQARKAGQLEARIAIQPEIDAANRRAFEAEREWSRATIDAVEGYHRSLANAAPIIVRATDKVTLYAQTPEGAVRCLAADRVRSIAEDRAALFPAETAVPAERGDSRLPAGTAGNAR